MVTVPNMIDFVMFGILVAIILLAQKGGVIVECVNLIGICCTIFIAVHYYSDLAEYLKGFVGEKVETESFSFIFLGVVFFVIFSFIAHSWETILKIAPPPLINKLGSFVLGAVRGYLTCGLIFLILLFANQRYITPLVKKSISRHVFRNAAVGFYKFTYDNLVKNFLPKESINEDIFEVIKEKKKKTDGKTVVNK